MKARRKQFHIKNVDNWLRMKALWRDPEFRAKMANRRRGSIKPGTQVRLGIPDGMRRPHANRLWARARKVARHIMSELEDKKVLVFTPEEEMAKRALEEAFVMALGPTDQKTKINAINTVLAYTKAKPASKSDLTLQGAEAWLKGVVEDAEKNG